MSEITPLKVKELREKTGAGMGDCKSALTEANGDMNAAIEILRKKGAASASKRADRAANEGIVGALTSADGKLAVMVEVNCETDFVARNAEFEKYVSTVTQAYLDNEVNSEEELLNLKVGSDTIQGLHNEILAKFSEKIGIRRFAKIKSEGYVASYIHAGSKLAVLVEISASEPNEQIRASVRDIAMQIAAMNPQVIDRSQVSEETIGKEIEIYKELAIKEGKNPDIAERIAKGRLEKFYQESCLIEQTFVKDPNKVIKDVVNEISKVYGSEVKINSFLRFFLGEA
jgi:elongation factor Ts